MFVRAYDAHAKAYYKSMVYALMDEGALQQAVLYHPALDSFVLQPHFCQDEGPLLRPLYEAIQSDRAGWAATGPEALAALHTAPAPDRPSRPVKQLCGYPEVTADNAFLQALLNTGFVPRERTDLALRSPTDTDRWTYIRTQADADALMEQFAGFHDATLDRLFYKERYGTRQLTVRFDNPSWYGTIDLCFEGLLALHLEPAGENFCRELMEGCLLVRDETVFWADAALTEPDPARARSYVQALNVKWRTVQQTVRPKS